jgi:hypothetical protein
MIFTLGSTSSSTTLNGSNCPLGSGSLCDATCGSLSSCTTGHHKGSNRLLKFLTSTSIYTYRIVGHRLCYYDGSTHSGVTGLGDVSGKNAITTTYSTPNLKNSIQHELSHSFGASHSTCTGSSTNKCTLARYEGFWCTKCATAIRAGK